MSRIGTFLFGVTEFLRLRLGGSRRVACVGDSATHPGSIISSGQDGTLKAGGSVVAVEGAIFDCDNDGQQPIYPYISKTFHNGKLIITEMSRTGCGAVIKPPDRRFYVG